MRFSLILTILSVITALPGPLEAEEFVVESVLTGLHHPSSVAVRPGGNPTNYEVFVAESGARRIVKISNNRPERKSNVVSEFPAGQFGNDLGYAVGPLGMLFEDHDHLIVVGGGREAGEEIVRLFKLPENELLITADQMLKSAGPLPTNANSRNDTGDVLGLARTKANGFVPDTLLIVSQAGDNRHGWLLKLPIRAGTLGKLSRFIPLTKLTGATAPTSIAVSEKGFVVVGLMGTVDEPHDSVLGFFNPDDGSLVMKLDTELHDITGLAYSRTSGNLYATDFALNDPQAGGVFRIEDASTPGKPACRAVRIATIVRPTALAFAPIGALYVTSLGNTDGTATGRGSLMKITGEL